MKLFGHQRQQLIKLGDRLHTILHQSDNQFAKLAGYEDLLEIVALAKACDKSYNLSFIGGPGTGKSLILWELRDQYGKRAVYCDGASTTGAGLIDFLKKAIDDGQKIECVIIDELDKMNKTDQKPLLNLFESGEVTSKKKCATYDFKLLNLKVFVSLNDIEALRPELKSRFRRLYLPEYSFEQFSKIAVKVLPDLSEETAKYIAKRTWETGTHDVRDVISLGKLVKKNHGPEKVDWIISTLNKYGEKK